jgi:hypothetical protein
MLPPFIIEQIRKREDEERARHEQQPQLELPIERPRPRAPTAPEEEKRGVIIVEL